MADEDIRPSEPTLDDLLESWNGNRNAYGPSLGVYVGHAQGTSAGKSKIPIKLADLVDEADEVDPQRVWAELCARVSQPGHLVCRLVSRDPKVVPGQSCNVEVTAEAIAYCARLGRSSRAPATPPSQPPQAPTNNAPPQQSPWAQQSWGQQPSSWGQSPPGWSMPSGPPPPLDQQMVTKMMDLLHNLATKRPEDPANAMYQAEVKRLSDLVTELQKKEAKAESSVLEKAIDMGLVQKVVTGAADGEGGFMKLIGPALVKPFEVIAEAISHTAKNAGQVRLTEASTARLREMRRGGVNIRDYMRKEQLRAAGKDVDDEEDGDDLVTDVLDEEEATPRSSRRRRQRRDDADLDEDRQERTVNGVVREHTDGVEH